MKLAYITSILSPGNDAQSIQVGAMWQSFGEILQDDFFVISPKTKKQKSLKYKTCTVPCTLNLPRTLRMLIIALTGVFVTKKHGVKTIYTRDILIATIFYYLGYKVGYEIHKPFETTSGKTLFKLVSNKIKIVAISQALKDFVVNKYNISNDVLVAHDGYFPKKFLDINKLVASNALHQFTNISLDKKIVLYTGLLNENRGGKLVIEAAKKLSHISFVLIGRIDPLLIKNDLPNNLIVFSSQSQDKIYQYMVGADVLLLPYTKKLKTWKYHSALKMFEYLATKTPIVFSDIGSTKEVLNNKNGYPFLPYVDEISTVISEALINEPKKVEVDLKKYTWSRRSENIISFIK